MPASQDHTSKPPTCDCESCAWRASRLASSPQPPVREPAPLAELPAPEPVHCAKRLGKDGGYHDYNVARGLAAKGREYSAEDRTGVLAAYEKAAENGHIGAQLELGWRRFESLYMGDAPTPDERELYGG